MDVNDSISAFNCRKLPLKSNMVVLFSLKLNWCVALEAFVGARWKEGCRIAYQHSCFALERKLKIHHYSKYEQTSDMVSALSRLRFTSFAIL